MKLASIALALAATTHAASNYTEWLAESFLSYPVSFSRNYANGVLYAGLELAYNKTGNPALLSFIQDHIDAVVDDAGNLINYPGDKVSLDDIRIGINLLNLWTFTGKEKYKIAADTLRKQIDITPRNAEGGFWHRKPTYPNQMWLDGIYMASNFYARYTKWFQPENRTAWDDIMLQYDLIEKHCRDTESGLLFHGYDGSGVAVWADPVTGAAPHVWDRAVGWYFMSLVDLLDDFPRSHPGWQRNLRRFQSLANALKKAQDEAGGWYLIMDEPYPSDPRNYIESSGSAMFTYGFLKGMRKGYLKRRDFQRMTTKAYGLLKEEFVSKNANGTINFEGTVEVGSLSSNGSFEIVTMPNPKSDKISDQYEVTKERINQAMDSISESAERSTQHPSKLFGQFHALKGSAVEAIGNVTGWENWQSAGKTEHEEGQREYEDAESWWPTE
ncbi:glycosyl hydrolase family 88-domain-containing protein [Aspergillus floccosus]